MPHDESQPLPTIRPNNPPPTEPPDTERGSASLSSAEPRVRVETPPAPPGFELGDELGRGGMGVVFAARDIEVGREVAVKLLRPEYVGHESSARRFVEEAQITGQLQHPGIPAVYRVGTLPDGSPFLAMKLVKGRTLADLLRDRTSLAADRGRFVAAFEGICQAVGYAHAHGVIHRDLKPQNVMVGAFGEVQVMDWGLAKVLTSGGVDPRRYSQSADTEPDTRIQANRGAEDATSAGSILGTPAFMPPEQAIGAVDKIDRQSDVFGLGGILCAILTGKPPYIGETSESTRQLAAQAKLSDAFSRLDGCGADPDLVALCQRCLGVEQTARPADAGVVSAAVAALRSAADERARQAERAKAAGAARRRTLTWAATAVVTVVSAGAAVSAWQAVRAGREAARAGREAERADLAARREKDRADGEAAAHAEADKQKNAAVEQGRAATAAKEFLQSILWQSSAEGQAAKDRRADPNLPLWKSLDYAAQEIDGKFADQPLIEADLRNTIGRAYDGLGRYADAGPHLQRAMALREQVLGPDHPDTLTSVNNLAGLVTARGEYPEAERLYRRALAGREQVLGLDHPDTLRTANNLADLYQAQQDYAAAEPLLRRAATGLERALGPDHPHVLATVNNLGALHLNRRELAAAEPHLTRALAGREKTLGPGHPDTLASVNNVAFLLEAKGESAAAEVLFRRALAGREQALGPDHPDTIGSIGNLAGMCVRLRHGKLAVPLFERYVAGRRQGGLAGPALANLLARISVDLLAVDQFAAAEKHLRECLAIREALQPAAWPTFSARSLLGEALLGRREYVDAEPLLVAGYDGLRQQEKTIPPQARTNLFLAGTRLIDLYTVTARLEQAAAVRATLPKEVAPPPRLGR